MIEKFVSPFIQQQFPAFYREQGPNFIAFLRAYYEWAEQTNLGDVTSGFIGKARSIPEYLDLDTTQQQFLKYFKNTYLNSIPSSTAANQALLTKHILDLYRSKGSPRSYELLFRLLFNEDIEFYIPSNDIFKPSDNLWYVPRYIETSDCPFIEQLIGQPIYSSSKSALAVVETVEQKIVSGKTINVMYLSSIDGNFKFGDKILSEQVPSITLSNAPTIIGSLTAIAVTDGGLGFNVGDILSVKGTGVDALARVAAVTNQNGKVTFNLVNGGNGYNINDIPIVLPTYNFGISGVSGSFNSNDILIDLTSGANGTVTRANSTFIELINYNGNFSAGDNVITLLGMSITNTSGMFTNGNIIVDSNTGANGVVYYANSSYVQIYRTSGNNQLFFSPGDQISNGVVTATVNSTFGSGITGNASLSSVTGGGGAGASFRIGGLINKEIYQINPDTISNYYNTTIDPSGTNIGYNVYINTQSGAFTVGNTATSSANIVMLEGTVLTANIVQVGEFLSNASLGIANLYVYDSEGSNGSVLLFVTGNDANLVNAGLTGGTVLVSNTTSSQVRLTASNPKQTITANATVFSQNTSMLGVQFTTGIPHGYYIHGATVTDTGTGHTAIVNNTVRTIGWGSFSGSASGNNLDSKLYLTLQFINTEVGTIAFLSNINPGSGYTTIPYINLTDTLIAPLQQSDGLGDIKGADAIVSATVLNANGISLAVNVIDSGFGYTPDEIVSLTTSNSSISISGTAVVSIDGSGTGNWLSQKSFTSGTQKLQDSYYYQNYSYEIGAMRMMSTYEDLVRSLVHPSGIALFGKYKYKDVQTSDTSNSVFLSIVQNGSTVIVSETS